MPPSEPFGRWCAEHLGRAGVIAIWAEGCDDGAPAREVRGVLVGIDHVLRDDGVRVVDLLWRLDDGRRISNSEYTDLPS